MATEHDTTVSELVRFLRRSQAALSEVGRPELAQHAHVVITPEGTLHLSCEPRAVLEDDPMVKRFLDIDPAFTRHPDTDHG